MALGLGREVKVQVLVDSSAALAVTNRKGNGKLRHIRIGQLWVQQVAEEETVAYKKVAGERNPADLCTKHLTRARMDILIPLIGSEDREGRADLGLEV